MSRHQVCSFVYLIKHECPAVDNVLARALLPTLPSTALLLSSWLKEIPPDTLEGLVSRLLRYVSSHPWGSTRAQAKGSRTTYSTAVAKMTEVDLPRRTFAAGAAVMFVPGAVGRDGSFRQSEPPVASRRAWRAQKAPPYSRVRLHTDKISGNMIVDITPRLLRWQEGEPYPTVLYDNRFLIKFDMSRVPRSVLALLQRKPDAQIRITYCLPEQSPRISLQVGSHEEIVADYRRDVVQTPKIKGQRSGAKSQTPRQSWVHMSLVRSIQAV